MAEVPMVSVRINNTELSTAQVLILRIALNTWLRYLALEGLPEDGPSQAITQLYLQQGRLLRQLLEGQ
jgi:hypothetical protein